MNRVLTAGILVLAAGCGAPPDPDEDGELAPQPAVTMVVGPDERLPVRLAGCDCMPPPEAGDEEEGARGEAGIAVAALAGWGERRRGWRR